MFNLNHFVFTGGSARFAVSEPMIENAESNIQLSPNPAVNFLNVYVSQKVDENAGILIYDNTGRQVLNYRLYENKTTVNVGVLSSGLYIIKLSNGKEIITKKFLKR